MKDIAHEAGVAQALLHYYFEGKNRLVERSSHGSSTSISIVSVRTSPGQRRASDAPSASLIGTPRLRVARSGRYSNRSQRIGRQGLLDLLIRSERELAQLAALWRQNDDRSS